MLPMARRMKLTLAYLGTPFCGWQRQLNGPTVQGEIESALARMVPSDPPRIFGAGRTDAGVHAAGQVAHVDLPDRIPPTGVLSFLRNTLHSAIRVRSVSLVGGDFHARYSALAKLYVYRARWTRPNLPWHDLRSAVVRPVEDLESLSRAAALLTGTHDVASFSVPDPVRGSTTRTLHRCLVKPRPGGLLFEFLGDGFLRYQVRRMVGALLEVGWGRLGVDEVKELVDAPRPGAPVTTAPAGGLTLEHVSYRRRQQKGAATVEERCGRLPAPGLEDAATR
jgi:tRNA pseudouridine38-40 synthase